MSTIRWLPDTLDECMDFWRLHLWVRQHPGLWTLDQVYARMLEINDGPPTDADLAVSARLSDPWMDGIGFLRLAELKGDLALEHDERFLTALIGLEPGLQLPLMRADRELREELVWGMLRQEGNRGVSLSSSDRSATMGSGRAPGWSRTLAACADEGLIDRDRLIDALLDMLAADLPSARAGWHSRTLRLLAMTLDEAEAEARQGALCALMSSPVGPTVTLAVGQLTALSKAGRLDLELFARSCEGALMGSKANALRVLGVLRDGLGAVEGTDLEPLLGVALSFPDAQVQRAALGLARDNVTASLLTRESVAAIVSQADLDPLVTPEAREFVSAGAVGDWPGPGLVPETRDEPGSFLSPPREAGDLVPMSAEDVSGRVGVLAEKAQMGLEYEALLAFLASPEFTPDALESLRPLVRHLTTRRFGYERMLGSLLQIALDGGGEGVESPLAAGTAWLESENMPTLLRERIIEVVGLIECGRRYRLLATPTDDRGAVNPLTLVRRALDNGDAAPLPADLTQALLRVDTEHPDCAAALALVEEREAELPAAARIRLALTGAVRRRAEGYLSSLSVAWEGHPAYESRSGKPKVARDGSPVYAFFTPRVVGADTGATGPELGALADIASASGDFTAHRYLYPASVRHFAVCLIASQWYVLDSTQLTADCYRALCEHGGRWDSLSAQLLGQAMGEREVESRALGVEALAALVARGDLSFDQAVAGFEAVAHTVKLNRWAQALQDLGNVDPRLALDLALALLPGIERGRTGIGQLLGVVTAQYARAQAEGWAPPLGEDLVGWLGLFRGSSQAAKYARTLKEMGQ